MQHYGIPTRLLDITTNPLVALYFACSAAEYENKFGEVVLIEAEESEIKWASSDTVSILASIPALSFMDNKAVTDWALGNDHSNSRSHLSLELTVKQNKRTNQGYNKLLGEIRKEKSGFEDRINAEDLFSRQFVYALRNNKRINNQSGAFILFGEMYLFAQHMDDFIYLPSENRFRSRNEDGKMVVLCIKNKKQILKQLDYLGINEEEMFPEIEDVSKSIKSKL